MARSTAASRMAAESAFLTVAFSRPSLEWATRQERDAPIEHLLQRDGADLDDSTTAVAFLSRSLMPAFRASVGALACEMALAPATVVVLVPWKDPPEQGTRSDGLIDSFLCDGATFRTLRERMTSLPPERSCFSLLEAILNHRMPIDRLVVRQLPYHHRPARICRDDRIALIMAHRGNPQHLAIALQSIHRADHAAQVTPRVGLDEEPDALHAYRHMRAQFPRASFCHVDPAPAGLFVVRQHFLECAHEDVFCLQDSDDFSCSDRFVAQLDELHATKSDVVGCHELRVDEMTGQVEALRLPLDVQKALRLGYSESLLNGTAIGFRRAVLSAGGYSTDQRIANDTQFMLRAYFLLRMRNIDGFYYLRRRHNAALTMAPATGFGTPLRESLRSTWAADFEAVLKGHLRLEDSSLCHKRAPIEYRIREWMAPADAVTAQPA
jgi:hypothetical protein